jgi:Protein of unknown function (DUF2934)
MASRRRSDTTPAAPIARRTLSTRKGAAAARSASGITPEMRRAMIAESAYLRAEARGFMPGREAEDWLAAETEVDALLKLSHGGSPQ